MARVPEAYRERIFEAFVRLPGHAERAGVVRRRLEDPHRPVPEHGLRLGQVLRVGAVDVLLGDRLAGDVPAVDAGVTLP